MEHVIIVKVRTHEQRGASTQQIINLLAETIEDGKLFKNHEIDIEEVHISTPDGLNAISLSEY